MSSFHFFVIFSPPIKQRKAEIRRRQFARWTLGSVDYEARFAGAFSLMRSPKELGEPLRGLQPEQLIFYTRSWPAPAIEENKQLKSRAGAMSV